ncbi:hypothetical protein P3179_002506 [Escherichia coli]|nr:hypothetical protein [Escherichia coli]
MSYEPPRDGYTNGYIVDVMYDNRPSKYPAVFRTYVRIPDYVELDNAEELADAIIREVELKEAWLTRVLGNSADPDASVGKWDRRLAQCGGIDEMSSGVQATYFSPNGQLVGLMAYIDAEWMDE